MPKKSETELRVAFKKFLIELKEGFIAGNAYAALPVPRFRITATDEEIKKRIDLLMADGLDLDAEPWGGVLSTARGYF